MKFNWKLWLEGLAVAAGHGALAAVIQTVASGGSMNVGTGISAALGALAGVATYLKTPATRGIAAQQSTTSILD